MAAPVGAAERPVSFANDIVPVLTKAGCNAGVCHAKAGNGQNGFQLSLLGFEPAEDFDHIVREGRGRRVFSAAPDRSLLLLKASGKVPHGGGVRLDASSEDYALLRAWISQGALSDQAGAATLVSFEVQPARGAIKRHATQQLKALARYSDGSLRDVTNLALYESSDSATAEVTPRGL
ncbi:MAG TPA: S-layer protein, partial [Pirellulales bacterium]